jgi:hypothetical protein
MRTLLALVLVVLAGFLIWHGFDTAAAAKEEFKSQTVKAVGKGSPDFEKLQHDYPYSDAAIDARVVTLDNQIAKTSGIAPPGKDELKIDLKNVWREIPDKTKAGISTEKPYVYPYTAAIIGVAGLLLALILPGTRFRGLAFLGLLLGAAAAACGMLPIEHQAGLVQKFSMLKYVIPEFPRVAQACVALAAITLAVRVRGPSSPAR